MTICPICKSRNFHKITTQSTENIKLTNKKYTFKRCSNCFVISQDPLPDSLSLTTHYQFLDDLQSNKSTQKNKLSTLLKIKKSYEQNGSAKNKLRNILKFWEREYTYFNRLNQKTILDLGAGNGIFSIAARCKGFEVISIEQNEASINFAKMLGIKIISSDINSPLSMKYASQSDNVTLNHVFEHIVEPVTFLKNLKKNIKKSAKVVIVMPNSNSIWRYVFKEKWYGWDPPVHLHLHNIKSIRKMMNEIGLKIEYLSTLNRIDSFFYSLNHAGYKVGIFKFLLRIIILPFQPILKLLNIAPELICIVSKK